MPVQSIDLSAVTDATFNGSAVEQIDLNGTGIWTKPSAGSALYTPFEQLATYTWYQPGQPNGTGIGAPVMVGNYTYLDEAMTISPTANSGDRASCTGLVMKNINGVAYVGGMIRGVPTGGSSGEYGYVPGSINVGRAMTDLMAILSPVGSSMMQQIPNGWIGSWSDFSSCYIFTNYWDDVYFYPIASISATDGFVLLDQTQPDAQSESYINDCTTTQYGTQCTWNVKAEYTRTQWTFTGKFGVSIFIPESQWFNTSTLTIDPGTKTITDAFSGIVWKLEP